MQPKPGLKTSELWLSIIVIAVNGIVAGLMVEFQDNTSITIASIVVAGIVDALVAVGYIVSRTIVKNTAEKKLPVIEVGDPAGDD